MTFVSGRQSIQIAASAPYVLPYPSDDIWSNFNRLVGQVFSRIEVNRKQSTIPAAQRDALLPGLVSGDVPVGRPCTARMSLPKS